MSKTTIFFAIAIISLIGFVCASPECDSCIKQATVIKPRLNRRVINEVINEQKIACAQLPTREEQTKCLARVNEIMLELVFLLEHTPEEFCKHMGACPEDKLRAINLLKNILAN